MNRKQIASRSRLASVMTKCFDTATPATRRALRLAVLSHVVGREIKSSNDLGDSEIRALLTRWEHYQSPFCPSDAAKAEIANLTEAYRVEHSQAKSSLRDCDYCGKPIAAHAPDPGEGLPF